MSEQGLKRNKNLSNELDCLVQGLLETRRLSQPAIDAVGNGDGYSRLLKKNLRRIQEIADINNSILNERLYPILEDTGELDEESLKALLKLAGQLGQSWPEEDLDLSLLFCVRRRLYQDAVSYRDDDAIAIAAGDLISASYSNLNRFNRIRSSKELTDKFQREGLLAAEHILYYLDKKNFVKLKTPGAREAVLSNARFYLALYDTWYTTDKKTNDLRIDGLLRANALADDPWYVEHAPGYDWHKHRLRTYEHLGQLTEGGNQWRMSRQQCERIQAGCKELSALWHSNEQLGEELLPEVHLKLILIRNSYFSGESTLKQYREGLIELYTRYANSEYDMYSVLANIFVTAEYLSTIRIMDTDEKTLEILRGLYRWIVNYVFNSRGRDAYSFMLEYLSAFLERFIEIPGEYSFENMALKCLAALDPPTYVHSMQVAALSRRMLAAMIEHAPESLIGTAGCTSAAEVTARKDELLNKVYHAGLCHDIGKLSMMDTIIIYGRELMETEHSAIRQHSAMSGYLLSLHPSTRGYAAACEAHHRWYDATKGYPAELACDDGQSAAFSWVISAAAAMDMATDEIGRSYREPKSLKLLLGELRDGAGTRYAPQLVKLFDDPQLLSDVDFLLDDGNEDNYRNTFLLLRDVKKDEVQDLDSRLEGFIVRTARIRELSAPQLSEIENAAEYAVLLKQHFQEIAMLAADNRQILEHSVYPLLNEKRGISDAELASLSRFCEELLNGQNLSDLDQGLVYRISRRLLSEAEEKGDSDELVRRLDMHILSCYEMMHQTKRMKSATELIKAYRDEGLAAAEKIWDMLSPKRFRQLGADSRKLVLINSRYAVYLWETAYEEEGINELFIQKLLFSEALADDPAYRELAPDYDWKYHRIRCLEYIASAIECGNQRRFSKALCEQIAEKAEELFRLCEADLGTESEILPEANVALYLCRSRYFAGRISLEKYRSELRRVWHSRREERYEFDAVLPNLTVPLELLISYSSQSELSHDERKEIDEIYRAALKYASRATNSGAFSLLMEYYAEYLYHFIETEDGLSFRDMGLYSMAALHPPTYLHSMMVAKLARCLCHHLIRRRPELLIGLLDCTDAASVKKHAGQIEELCHNAALTHDFGKIPMIDTIFVYGRRLMEPEYALVSHHPKVGEELLAAHESTKRYAKVAAGHHRWYDGTGGYPEDFDLAASQDRILIDIVAVADSLDAATDAVGRSYSGEKSVGEITSEIMSGAGSRYSPEVARLLGEGEVYADISRLLDEERKKNYQDTFDFLKGIPESDAAGAAGDKSGTELLKHIKERLAEEDKLKHAHKLVEYDRQTVCPPAGAEEAGEVMTALAAYAYRIRKEDDFISAVEQLYEQREALDAWDACLIGSLHKEHLRRKNISTEQQAIYDDADQRAWVAWNTARDMNDFGYFKDALARRRELAIERVSLWDDKEWAGVSAYDRMLDEHERGMRSEVLDELFSESLPRLRALMKRIEKSKKKIRTDFLSRRVEDEQQAKAAEYLIGIMGFDSSSGCMGLSTHPFTERMGRNDVRLTTHYDPKNFLSSIYSVIHECGHALFEQLQPEENHTHFIADEKTMGQHESASRFYENIIGRSRGFISLIYPKLCEIFPQLLYDVSEQELYEAVNLVSPSLIRTEADELSYSLHIIIRYELEKEMIEGGLPMERLPAEWNAKYADYLGVEPKDALSGVLQDVHWTDSFAYFPTYALGNYYGAMYLKRMQEELDPFAAAKAGDFAAINSWMSRHVFARADRLAPREWIKDITGSELSAGAFIKYLEDKYSRIYEL